MCLQTHGGTESGKKSCPNFVPLSRQETGQGQVSDGAKLLICKASVVALLTIYDMAKAMDRGMVITDVKLLEKQEGKSGSWSASA